MFFTLMAHLSFGLDTFQRLSVASGGRNGHSNSEQSQKLFILYGQKREEVLTFPVYSLFISRFTLGFLRVYGRCFPTLPLTHRAC